MKLIFIILLKVTFNNSYDYNSINIEYVGRIFTALFYFAIEISYT